MKNAIILHFLFVYFFYLVICGILTFLGGNIIFFCPKLNLPDLGVQDPTTARHPSHPCRLWRSFGLVSAVRRANMIGGEQM